MHKLAKVETKMKNNFIHLITSFAYMYMSIAQKRKAAAVFLCKRAIWTKAPGIAYDNEIANLPVIFFSKFIFYYAYFTLTFPLIKFAFQRSCMFLIIPYDAACTIIDQRETHVLCATFAKQQQLYVCNKSLFKIFPLFSFLFFFNAEPSKRVLRSTTMWKRVIVTSANTERQLQLSRDRLISLP